MRRRECGRRLAEARLRSVRRGYRRRATSGLCAVGSKEDNRCTQNNCNLDTIKRCMASPCQYPVASIMRLRSRKSSLKRVFAAMLVFWIIFVTTGYASADNLRETGGSSLMAIPEFGTSAPSFAKAAVRIRDFVIERLSHSKNCTVTDAFDAVKYDKFPRAPDFSVWRSRHIRFLVLGQIGPGDHDALKLEARIFDVSQNIARTGQIIVFSPIDWQNAASSLAESILSQAICS
jgi:TolB amino-terminal domain